MINPEVILLPTAFINAFLKVSRLCVELNYTRKSSSCFKGPTNFEIIGGKSVKQTEAKISFGYNSYDFNGCSLLMNGANSIFRNLKFRNLKKLVVDYFPRPQKKDWNVFTSNNPGIRTLNIEAKFGREFDKKEICVIAKNLPGLEYITFRNIQFGKEFNELFVYLIIKKFKKLKAIEFNCFCAERLVGILKRFQQMKPNFIRTKLNRNNGFVESLVMQNFQ